MTRYWLIVFALLLAAPVIRAAETAQRDKTGIQLGQKASDFKLMDQDGQERTLSDLLMDGPVALVFYRSASW